MSILVSDSNNPSYDGLSGTTNGWFRAEAYNLGANNLTAISLATTRNIPVTFANAGNCQGISLILNWTASSTRSAAADLEEAITVGSFNVTTERINIVGHGLLDDQRVRFSSTGTLPGGIVNNTIYYVINATADDFQISTSPGSTVQPLSGTPTGTATCWALRATKTLAYNEIANMTATRNPGIWITPFKFTTPYAVDTTASKWRFTTYQTGGAGNSIFLKTSNATDPSFVAWCDTQVSFSNDDIPILVDPIAINQSNSWGAALGTGDTVYGIGGWICRSSDGVTPNLTWVTDPAADYTLTIKGLILRGAHSRIKIGEKYTLTGTPAAGATSATLSSVWARATGTYTIHFPINGTESLEKIVTLTNGSAAITWTGGLAEAAADAYLHTGVHTNKAIITFNTVSVGTTAPCFFNCTSSSGTYEYGGKTSIEIYGEIPAVQYTTLASDAAAGQQDIVTTDATGWSAGDRIVIGKSSVFAVDNTIYTIDTCVGTAINVSANITNARLAGATVFRLGGYTVELTHTSGANGFIDYQLPGKLIVSGAYVVNVGFSISGTITYSAYVDDAANRAKYQFTNISTESTGTAVATLLTALYSPILGALIQKVYAFRRTIIASNAPINGATAGNKHKSGVMYYRDCRLIQKYATADFASTTAATYEANNIIYEHSQYGGIYLSGVNSSVKNCVFWDIRSVVYATYATILVYAPVNCVSENNTFDACGVAFNFFPFTSVNSKSVNDIFGATSANILDVYMQTSALIDFTFESPTGNLVIDTTFQTDTTPGSKIGFTDFNDTANDDRAILTFGRYQRTGDGLSDTTVHTSGTGKFAFRLAPESSTDLLEWSQDIPTGDIQSKTMMIGCWVKLNAAAYWAGTNQMPRLTISYDNGAGSAYAEAAQTTEWQFIFVPITPTTDYAQITATVSGMTDALTTDAYFYIDDFSVLYPSGHIMNMSGLDYWSEAEPVMPTISTLFSAADVWNVSTSTLTGTGTIGKMVVTIYKFILKILTK